MSDELAAPPVEVAGGEMAERDGGALFRLIVEGARDYAILTTDPEGRIQTWSPGAEEVFGWRDDEAIGQNVAMTFTPADRAAGAPEQERATARRDGVAPDVRWHLCSDGGRVFIEGSTRRMDDGAGRVRGFVKIGQDVTERRRMQARLREMNDTLEHRVAERTAELAEQMVQRERAEDVRRQVLRQLVTAEEDERRRISRELHDEMGQQVTGLLLGLRALKRDAGSPEAEKRVGALEKMADRLDCDLQNIALQLRPPALDNLGLKLALQGHLEEWSHRHSLAADFHAGGVDGRLPPEVETTLYRAVQETLTNVLKHAGATRVSVILERRDGTVSVIVEDDGAGFDVDRTLALPEKAGRLGVRGMRERVALLGGEMEIESAPGAGTTVYVRVPDGQLTGEEAE